jgi:hypothetical protein
MADLPITSDNGGMPVVINDPTTPANVASVSAAGDLHVQSKTEDGSGNLIASVPLATGIPTAGNFFGATVNQAIALSNSTSTANLAAGASFTGAADLTIAFTTFAIAVKTDQPLSIQVQQSPDNVNWDIVDTYTVAANTGDARSFQILELYIRAVVTNTGASTTTFFRLQSALVPIADVVPRALTQAGNFKTTEVTNMETYAAQLGQIYTTSFEVNLNPNGTEVPTAYIKNPAASGKVMIIRDVYASGTTTNGEATIRMYANPTSSANGTAQTITSTSIGGGAAASSMTAFTSPTVSANGVKLLSWSIGSGNFGPNSAPALLDGLFRLSANNNILFTGQPSGANINTTWTIIWQEVTTASGI